MNRQELESALRVGCGWNTNRWVPQDKDAHATLMEAARAYLATLPRTKKVEVWHVEYVERDGGQWRAEIETREDAYNANRRATYLKTETSCRDDIACIRVTGPHQHEVPDDAR